MSVATPRNAACVVHLDGKAVKSCTTLAVMTDGYEGQDH
jgi:aerobic carbon-monoxide dehydrogenase small subunit